MKKLQQKLTSALVIIFIFTFTTNAQPPLLDEWESNMTTWGDHWGIYMQTYTPPNSVGMIESNNGIYYDAQRIHFQIADYTGQAEPWNTHAQEAERIYRIYLNNRFNWNNSIPWFTQGWRRFSHGILMDAQRTADPISVEGVVRMRDNGSFANVLDVPSFRVSWHYENKSREIAYMISAHINAEKFDLPRQEEALAHYVTMSMKHLDEWITETYADPIHRLSPFMVGLTSEAIIEFYEWEVENGRDPSALFTHPAVAYNPTRTIPEALTQVAYHMRYTATVESGVNAGKLMWVEDMGGSSPNWNDTGGTGYSALRYESINSAKPSPALNLLIAPLYAWVFKQTGEMDYIDIGDKLWEAGVATTNVGWNTKTYNQNFRWSFDYIKWRNEGFNQDMILINGFE